MPIPIFHIAEEPAWAAALRDGSYAISTRGASLADVGFIHCSFRDQVETVANAVYADWDEQLLLLEIAPDRVGAEIRVENLDGGQVLFPHVYGPLPPVAVVGVERLRRDNERWAAPNRS